MKKYTVVTLLTVLTVSLLTANVLSQVTDGLKTEQKTNACSGEKFVMPATIVLDNEVFADYLKVVTLPAKERGAVFRAFTNEQKASYVRVQYAMQLIKHPQLTKGQRDFILEAISKTTVDIYDKNDPSKKGLSQKLGHELEVKAMSIFEPRVAASILAANHGNKDFDIALIQNYQALMTIGMSRRKVLVKEKPITERANLWRTQLVYHLATSYLSDDQKVFIAEMMPNIETILDTTATLSPDNRAQYGEELEQSILKYFTKTEAYALFMAIGIQKVVKDNDDSLQSSCNCRWYCDDWSQNCNQGSCRARNFCGPFDDWECSGRCG